MLKAWAIRLVTMVVAVICLLTVAQALDCHVQSRSGHEPKVCEGVDERALSTLLGLLGTLLALRIPLTDDDDGRTLPSRDSEDFRP